jgi:hypothetical protein
VRVYVNIERVGRIGMSDLLQTLLMNESVCHCLLPSLPMMYVLQIWNIQGRNRR